MRPLARIAVTVFAFWAITASALYAGTFIHEFSHYAAHEGAQVPEVRFFDTPDDARADLVHVETVDHDGRRYRMENVQETTIVLYDDAILYAMTLNLLPIGMYDTGSLGATFLHATEADTPSIIAGAEDEHWGVVMGAPLVTAVVLFMLCCTWIVVRPDLMGRALFVAYAAELGNNAHHAPAVGLDSTAYAVAAEVIFGLALVTVILLSPTYRSILAHAGGKTPAWRSSPRPYAPGPESFEQPTPRPAGPSGSLRFRHVRGGPPTPGRASLDSFIPRRWGS